MSRLWYSRAVWLEEMDVVVHSAGCWVPVPGLLLFPPSLLGDSSPDPSGISLKSWNSQLL